jgi:hypothetical protein
MGWNDHVEFVSMRCDQCGEIDDWEIWNDVAQARYGGAWGKELGHDIANHNRCPLCGGIGGTPVDEEDEW